MNQEQNAAAPGIWREILSVWDELKVCRFAVIVALIGLYIFCREDQGIEVLRALGEDVPASFTFQQAMVRLVAAIAGAFIWALASWYTVRVLLYIDFPYVRRLDGGRWIQGKLRPFLVTWLPRMLGAAPFLVLAMGFAKASTTYDTGATPPRILKTYAAGSAVIAAGLLVAFARRCKEGPIERIGHRRSGFKQLDASTRWALTGMVLLSVALLVLFSWNPILFGGSIGTAGVLLFSAATWVVFGGIAIYVASWIRFPVITAALLWIALCSLWNDNHPVRRVPPLGIQRPTLEEAFQRWREHVSQLPERRHPLFIVATEGGGIRAAYWTATVLGTLEEKSHGAGPDFADHLFAISGVSGGSVGAAVFDAKLATVGRVVPKAPPESVTLQVGAVQPVNLLTAQAASYRLWAAEDTHQTQAMLGTDFLAPVMAAFLYPDLFQRFLPTPFAGLDRGQWLEKSWEKAGRESLGNDELASNFDSLWRNANTKDDWLPALFLNGTKVETGQRIIASNLVVDGHFPDAIDLARLTAHRMPGDSSGCEVALSTAAHGSARFTYISPAGRFANGTHIVDGGYYENSGSTTATEILRGIEDIIAREKIADVQPYIIMISNDPSSSPHGGRKMESGHDSMSLEMRRHQPSTFLEDFIAPLSALFATRDAHNSYAQIALQQAQHFQNSFYFGLSPSQVPLPLGWMLSGTAAEEMNRQIEKSYETVDGKDNPERIAEVLAVLKAAADTAPEVPAGK